MKLSEAMMLGSTLCVMKPRDFDTCALGCAASAIGIRLYHGYIGRLSEICKAWPWLDFTNYDEEIFSRFDDLVCRDLMTFEQLVDYVRSVEPECGECNRFECSCSQALHIVETTAISARRT